MEILVWISPLCVRGTPVIMNGQQTQVLKYKDTEADIQGWSMRKYNPLKSTVNELNLGLVLICI